MHPPTPAPTGSAGTTTTLRLARGVVAALAGLALLVAADGSAASLTDEARPATVRVSSGALTATLTASGPAQVVTGTSSVVVVPAGARGLVPGVQGQQWTYVVGSEGNGPQRSAVPSRATMRIRSTAVSGPYAVVQPHLRIAWSVAGGASGTVPASAITPAGIDHTVSLPGTLQPGQAATVRLTFSLPATAGTTELARSLGAARSTTVDARTMVTMANVFTLHQVPRTS